MHLPFGARAYLQTMNKPLQPCNTFVKAGPGRHCRDSGASQAKLQTNKPQGKLVS